MMPCFDEADFVHWPYHSNRADVSVVFYVIFPSFLMARIPRDVKVVDHNL